MHHAIENHPMVTTEKWEQFSADDHAVWKLLVERQEALLVDRAAPEFLQGLEKLAIAKDQIPKFSELNAKLAIHTGFRILPVTGLIPPKHFFKCLATRYFPSTCFIRKREQLDYLEEPDIFHDVYGHVPLLVHEKFADFMQAYGELGCQAETDEEVEFIATLYWFTVEFGLLATDRGLKIYGAGILSSPGESVHSLASEAVKRIPFAIEEVVTTAYRTDIMQQLLYVISDYQQLFDAVSQLQQLVEERRHELR